MARLANLVNFNIGKILHIATKSQYKRGLKTGYCTNVTVVINTKYYCSSNNTRQRLALL